MNTSIKFDKTKYKGVWKPNTYYDETDMVFYNGALWLANTAFTSGATFDEVNWTCPSCVDSPATVVITSDESSFTDATPFEIQITFNKSVTGFVVGDIATANATLSNFAGSGASYTADVTPDLAGDIIISIDANVTAEGNSASNVVTVTDNVPTNLYELNLKTPFPIAGAAATLNLNKQYCEKR